MSERIPELSVVVALISGKRDDLCRCLEALARQEDAPALEILVPFDPPCRHVLALNDRFPEVRFMALDQDTSSERAGAGREHHDTLRTLGLKNACAQYVVLTEDHAHADRNWCAELVQALKQYPHAGCVGGAVEYGGDSLLTYATYICDFIRYANPLPEDTAWFVSDSNVCYRREALEKIADEWRNDYHETIVHEALRHAGYQLRLTPRAVVWQTRSGLTIGSALRERYIWGRSYAGSRFRHSEFGLRMKYALMGPLLPFVLTWRYMSAAWAKKHPRVRLLFAMPLVFLLSTAWAVGEWWGYVTGRPR